MITELISALIISIGFIGAIMAMKWKGKNVKPRVSDEELDKYHKGHEKSSD